MAQSGTDACSGSVPERVEPARRKSKGRMAPRILSPAVGSLPESRIRSLCPGSSLQAGRLRSFSPPGNLDVLASRREKCPPMRPGNRKRPNLQSIASSRCAGARISSRNNLTFCIEASISLNERRFSIMAGASRSASASMTTSSHDRSGAGAGTTKKAGRLAV